MFTSSVMAARGYARLKPVAPSLVYPKDEYVGKDLVQVGRDKHGKLVASDANLFDKYQQAMASSADLIGEAADIHRPRRAMPVHTAILPILAVSDGTLWIAKYSSNGKIVGDPEPASEVTFFLGREYPMERDEFTFKISHLHIMTRSYLPDFLRQIGEPPQPSIWDLLFPDHLMVGE